MHKKSVNGNLNKPRYVQHTQPI